MYFAVQAILIGFVILIILFIESRRWFMSSKILGWIFTFIIIIVFGSILRIIDFIKERKKGCDINDSNNSNSNDI